MGQIEIRFAPTAREAAHALSDALDDIWTVDIDAIAMVETAPGLWAVTAYIGDAGDLDLKSVVLDPTAERLGALPASEIVAGEEKDWVVEGLKDLKPVAAGRYLVHGSHDRDAVRPGRIAIEIDAGAAFGTGHHGTTAGCLTALDDVARKGPPNGPILDLGTGSGVLAIAAAKTFRKPVIATDIDPVATQVAAENARRNGVASLVRTVTGQGTKIDLVRSMAPYDLIFANILAKPLIRLAPEIGRAAAPGGRLILSGLLEPQVPPVRAAFQSAGFSFAAHDHLEGWATLTFRRN